MDYKVGICDQDYHYMFNLMEYINSNNQLPLKMVAFSTEQALAEYIDGDYLDCVVLGQGMRLSLSPDVKTVHLSENHISQGLFKYQAADIIAEKLMCEMKVNGGREREDTALFVGVYSPLGRSGKTSLARAICNHCEGSLYIGFEEFSPRDSVSERFLYYLVEESEELIQLVNELSVKNINELCGILSYLDVRQVNKQNMEWFKRLAVNQLKFSKFVFDIGGGVLSDEQTENNRTIRAFEP